MGVVIPPVDDDQVVLAPGNVKLPRMQETQIAGMVPAAEQLPSGLIFPAEIAGKDAVAGDGNLSNLILRQRRPLVVHDANSQAGQGNAGRKQALMGCAFLGKRDAPFVPAGFRINQSTRGTGPGGVCVTAKTVSAIA